MREVAVPFQSVHGKIEVRVENQHASIKAGTGQDGQGSCAQAVTAGSRRFPAPSFPVHSPRFLSAFPAAEKFSRQPDVSNSDSPLSVLWM
jgi:hypothetical protein